MKDESYYYGQQDVFEVFKNDQKIITSLFVSKIKNKKISSFFKEIIMVIYDPQRT